MEYKLCSPLLCLCTCIYTCCVWVCFCLFLGICNCIVLALAWKLAGLRWSTRQGRGWRAPALPMYLSLPFSLHLYLSSSYRLSLLVIVLALVIACHRLSACMEISRSFKTRMWMESPCCEEMRDFLMTRGASTDFYRHPPTSNVIHDKLPTYGFVPLREPLHCSRNCPKFEAGPLCEIES